MGASIFGPIKVSLFAKAVVSLCPLLLYSHQARVVLRRRWAVDIMFEQR
jgi:hypothetical protein